MVISFLFSCKNNESQYKCPKCTIEYCSLACFKDERHSRCTEKFYQDQIKEALKSEKLSELSDERDKMIKIIEKLKNVDADDSDFSDDLGDSDGSEDLVSVFEDVILEDLNVKDFEEILGEEHLKNIQELIEKGVTKEWLTTAGISEGPADPWFKRYSPSDVVLNEELPAYVPKYDPESIPDIKTLTKKTPSDFLWNNLLEISVIYSFIHCQFSESELKDKQILEIEVKPIFMELCGTIHSVSSGEKESIYMSAVDALEAAKSAIFFNSSDYDINETFSCVNSLLRHPKLLLIMLSDLKNWFKKSKIGTDAFKAEKKLSFLLSWLKSEVDQSKASVDEILKTLRKIVEQFTQ